MAARVRRAAFFACKNSGLLINWKQDNKFRGDVFGGGADAGINMSKKQTRAPEGLEERYEKIAKAVKLTVQEVQKWTDESVSEQ